ncbi:MAG: VWA domain-containing protein [Deltaproteobacteria bacterium]|nr:VWA domain-containing protein [Deltaproteobacteria bacterium]
MLRRLPVYLLLDCSESMAGPPLDAVENGVVTMLAALRKNPYAMETVHLSIITFDAKARVTVPLTEIPSITPPRLKIRPGTSLGAALNLLQESLKNDVVKTTSERKGDYRPLVFILTDGQPTDQWRPAADRLRSTSPKPANIYGIGCGDEVDFTALNQIADVCLHMRGLSTESFAQFFVWMSASVQSMSVAPEEKVSFEKIPLQPGMELVDRANPPVLSERGERLFFHVCCRKTKKHYLMRYRYEPAFELYIAQDAIPLEDDFFSDGALKSPAVSSEMLHGNVPCPHCHADSWAQCGFCKHLFCIEEDFNEPFLVCPLCETKLTGFSGGSFGVEGSMG